MNVYTTWACAEAAICVHHIISHSHGFTSSLPAAAGLADEGG